MSKTQKANYFKEKHPFYGKKFSEEHKRKLSESYKHQNPYLSTPIGKCVCCGKEMKINHLNRYHNNNCKFKI